MISTVQSPLYTVNLTRPTFSENDEKRDFWLKVHALIKECDIPIVINSAFDFVDHSLQKQSGYAGGGMSYVFWFNTAEDQMTFMNMVDEIHREMFSVMFPFPFSLGTQTRKIDC